MPMCVVKWCRSHNDLKDAEISFHEFPRNEVRRIKWTAAVRLERGQNDWMPSKRSKICSIHFGDDDIYASKKGLRLLKNTAVPICTMVNSSMSSFSEPEHSVEPNSLKRKLHAPSCSYVDVKTPKLVESTQHTDNFKNTADVKTSDTFSVSLPFCSSPINIPSSDIESVFDTPRKHKLKKELRQKTALAEKRLLKFRSLQRKNKRLIKKNIKLKDVIAELKKKTLGESHLHTALSGFAGDITCTLQKKKSKKGRSIIKFTPVIKKFALTLNYYSPAGYMYVRKQLMSCLPHPSTISKWYQNIDGKPGFTKEAFRALQSKYGQSNKNLACLIVDEMAIRQQKIFNGTGVDGLVTHGPPEEIATQVYVQVYITII